MINAKSGLYSLMLSLMLGITPAWADVDISSMNKVEVGSWAELKAAVEDSANAGKAIVLTKDITADKDNPITSVGGAGIVIDGGGFTITGQEGTKDGQFISFDNKNNDLVFQNVNFDGIGIYRKTSGTSVTNVVRGSIIYNNSEMKDIHGIFSNNYASSDLDVYGGVIYNAEGKNSIGIINNISGEFLDNYVKSEKMPAYGGAIANKGSSSMDGSIIKNINATFSGNYALSDSSYAEGGAIYNYGTIGDISGDFSGNFAKSDSSSAFGGAIYNANSYYVIPKINNINADFTGNFAKSETSDASGGAIYNGSTIGNITGNFSGNYAQADSGSANGGAIYNTRTPLTLVNSSFYDNYAETGAEKENENGKNTKGGAIYSTKDLTIKADNGQSIFSGNKVKWANGEDSSAIFQDGGTLTLDSQNNGLIKFDDKIATSSPIKDYLEEAQANGATITDDGNGGYILTYDDGTDQHVTKTENGFLAPDSPNDYSADELEDNLAYYRDGGCNIQQDGDNYIITGNMYGSPVYAEIIKQEDGSYSEIYYDILTEGDANIVITGDESSRVEFNNALENIGSIDISGTNVDVNEGVGTIYRTVTHDGGVLNINTGATAEDSVVNDKGTLHVASGGLAENTTVNSGGTLIAENEAKVNNMLANDGANLDIDAGSLLSGDIVIHAGATMGGSYDYSKIFKDEVADAGSLTLIGGLNDALSESSLINTTEGKKLHLTDGSYVIGDGAYAVNGWDLLTLQNNANVKLEGDITLNGPNKKLIIKNGSELNLAGNSPTNYTITGSVSNDGSMTFTHAGDDADDITTIYGNYTAYNNAQMTIDVNPTDNTSDLLRIDGDVAGTTNVVLNIVGADVAPTELLQFVDAQNDDLSTGAYFKIFRVDGSAFKWNSLYKDNGWYTGTDDLIPNGSENGYGDGDKGNIEDDENLEDDAVLPPNFPDAPSNGGDGENKPSNPSVVGEAIAYMGLPSAGIEQTRGMTRNVAEKVAATKVYSKQCNGFYDCQYDGKALRNAWAAPVYSYSDVKAPYSYEAEISGFEGGFDVQSDVYNRLGVFASYRQGSYDFDGDGDDYYSKTGADMDIDSYILGLYHRYDEGRKWMMSQIFLGYQDVSMSSDDGVSSSTDGIEFGAAIEGGLIFNPMTNLTIEPIIRLAYTQINYDDATDNYGKTAHYGDVSNIEVEAGVKVEKTYLRKNGYAKLYVKPSIIQNIGSGDVQVTSLRQVDGLENSTLGRLEVGGSMSFDERWSGFANAAYTFGSDYTNLGLNAGLNYAF